MGGPPAGAGGLVGQRLGKYELLALLALGGTAEIYLARIDGTSGFEKYVVVKCLHDHLAEDDEFVSMFLDEARLGAQLDHSNIVQTLALGQHEDRYYLVMEFIAGLSLALVGRRAVERVRGGKVPVPIVLNIAAQACEGLQYAHDKVDNLVHRDISPQNLVITYEGLVKLVDFGIAKADQRETRTRSGTVKGKFAYMSPEQCQAGDVDRRTDVFALGVITWELLTGRRLFKRDTTYETYQAVVACDVPDPSAVNVELDPGIDAIVMKALAKDKAKRYPSAEAFGEAMTGYLHHRGKPSGPGEIARFFEECFRQEIEEHFVRMRDLIEGRKKSIAEQKLLQWDSSELDGSASVLEGDDLDAILEESASHPAARIIAQAAATGVAVGPVSPPMARRKPEPAPAPPPEDFDSKTDDEAWRTDQSADPTRIEASPMESLAAMRKPAAPPRKVQAVLTPPGLRAGGAPLDPLPHEQMLTPPPTAVPPPRPAFIQAPTVIAEDPRPAQGRFSDAPTVHDARQATPAGMPRFADAPTVLHVEQPVLGPSPSVMPPSGATQALETDDLLEANATDPYLPPVGKPQGWPSPAPDGFPPAAQLIAMPPPAQAFPNQPYYARIAAGGEPRKLPPWLLGVMFVIVAALATGITVAIARAMH